MNLLDQWSNGEGARGGRHSGQMQKGPIVIKILAGCRGGNGGRKVVGRGNGREIEVKIVVNGWALGPHMAMKWGQVVWRGKSCRNGITAANGGQKQWSTF